MKAWHRPGAVLLLTVMSDFVRGAESDHEETRLLAFLFGPNYDPRARPPFRVDTPVGVSFRLNIRQIYDVNERAQSVSLLSTTYQEWNDPRLQWNATDYDGLDSFSVFYTNVWTPDTTLYNTVDMYNANVQDRNNANIKANGGNDSVANVQIMYNTHYTIGCRFNMKYFPFDKQNCSFIFGSWTYDQGQINYSLPNTLVTTEGYRESDEWSLISFEIVARSEKYACCKNPYQVLYAHLVMKRKSLYYIFNLVLPTVIINIMASFGLFASAGNAENREDKLQIGITTLLSYCILLLTVSDQIPKGSTSIPLMSWFFFLIMVQNAVKMYLAVLLSYPDRRRAMKAACWRLKDKTLYYLRRSSAVATIPTEKRDKNEAEVEDRLPEVICLWISVAFLAIITAVMFVVAN